LVSAVISLALLGSSIWVEESQVWIQSRRKAEPVGSDHDHEGQPLIASKHCAGLYKSLADLFTCVWSDADHANAKAAMMTSWDLLVTSNIPLRHARKRDVTSNQYQIARAEENRRS